MCCLQTLLAFISNAITCRIELKNAIKFVYNPLVILQLRFIETIFCKHLRERTFLNAFELASGTSLSLSLVDLSSLRKIWHEVDVHDAVY